MKALNQPVDAAPSDPAKPLKRAARAALLSQARRAYKDDDLDGFSHALDAGLPIESLRLSKVDSLTLSARTALDVAMADGRPAWAVALWRRGAVSFTGVHPLFQAACEGQTDLARAFLEFEPQLIFSTHSFAEPERPLHAATDRDALWLATRFSRSDTADMIAEKTRAFLHGPQAELARASLQAARAVADWTERAARANVHRTAKERLAAKATHDLLALACAGLPVREDQSRAAAPLPPAPAVHPPTAPLSGMAAAQNAELPEFAKILLAELASLRGEVQAQTRHIASQRDEIAELKAAVSTPARPSLSAPLARFASWRDAKRSAPIETARASAPRAPGSP